jgi:AcrR family transcriptional regulator
VARKRSLDGGPAVAQLILDHAAQLFYSKGYEQASIRDLADSAGISPSTVYHHFQNKQEIAYRVLVRFMRDFNDATIPVMRDSAQSAASRITEAIRLHIEISDKRRPELLRLRGFRSILSEAQGREVTHMEIEYHDAVKGLIIEGCQAGEFRTPDPTLATMAVLDMLNGVRSWFRQDGVLTLSEVVHIYTAMVHKLLADVTQAPGGGR